jgi:hypothetical protein
MSIRESTRSRRARRLAVAAAILAAAATAGSAWAGAVGGPEYGIVRVNSRIAQLEPGQRARALEDREAATNGCLREHGWQYRRPAVRRLELRVGHPCGPRCLGPGGEEG